MSKRKNLLANYVEEDTIPQKGKQRARGKIVTVANIDLNRVLEMYGQEVARRVAAEAQLAELTKSSSRTTGEIIEVEWQEKGETE